MSLFNECASLFIVGFPGTSPDVEVKKLISDGVGGVILFKRNVENAPQIASLVRALKTHAGRPLIASVDQEGGRVARLRGAPFTALPPMRQLGLTGDLSLVERAGRLLALECRAMQRVRDEMGLTNVILMLPFVRRIVEADLVLQTMADLGLRRGENGLKVYAMCEIPNNVILIDEFAKRFDGFSIGSNDLTQLTLGVDRDSEIVAFDYDERDEGVKEMIRLAVEGCRRNGIHSGLCGQAPSDYPDMAEFLVRLGIDSISLNPDVVVKTTRQILELEQQVVPLQ